MSPEHEKQLFDAAPTFYQREQLPWGFECGDGWFDLLLDLGQAVEALNASLPPEARIVAGQVKEKLGSLRCYTKRSDDRFSAIRDLAEERASKTCSTCGQPGSVVSVRGWIRVTCAPCQQKRP